MPCGCATTALECVPDPVWAAHVAPSCACGPPTMSGIVKFSADVVALKNRLDPQVKALDRAVAACAALDATQKQAWLGYWNSWVMYRDSDVSWLSASNQYDDGIGYEHRAMQWQQTLDAVGCSSGIPKIVADDPASGADIVSAIKLGAVAVIVAATVYGVSRFV